MSGRGSPRRKLSCSVISSDLERQARPDRNPLYAAADPPASGRCPTARGPSVGPSRDSLDRPHVLFSVLRIALCKSDQGANGRTLRSFRCVGPVALKPERPSDVQMRPFSPLVHGGFEEGGGGDGASGPSTSAVSDVGHLTLDLVAVLVRKGQRPDPIAGSVGVRVVEWVAGGEAWSKREVTVAKARRSSTTQ